MKSNRTPMAAANWKMNGDFQSVTDFVKALDEVANKNLETDVVFSPPAVYLSVCKSLRAVKNAAQTGSEFESGAYTGETSMAMLADVGCQYVILGHSERRAIYQETDEEIIEKVLAAFDNDLTPILCIGETDEENQSGQTESVLATQLKLAIERLTTEQKQKIVLAYEPVWAIGTGRTPSVEDIQEIHEKIRYLFCGNDDRISSYLRILYGGSVKPSNAESIFACADVDGGLVGGASLEIESFEKIIKALK